MVSLFFIPVVFLSGAAYSCLRLSRRWEHDSCYGLCVSRHVRRTGVFVACKTYFRYFVGLRSIFCHWVIIPKFSVQYQCLRPFVKKPQGLIACG
ncbi:hypothetical protein DER46DRAFT_46084 [Fusarium sp. MPI-SDFR-AT-0072]|nr:hypothetical protein DER46DRAFT_46084 [Fusarium sp. MPI-SDFR-AT-0072]